MAAVEGRMTGLERTMHLGFELVADELEGLGERIDNVFVGPPGVWCCLSSPYLRRSNSSAKIPR